MGNIDSLQIIIIVYLVLYYYTTPKTGAQEKIHSFLQVLLQLVMFPGGPTQCIILAHCPCQENVVHTNLYALPFVAAFGHPCA
jgi:hypothetical protein